MSTPIMENFKTNEFIEHGKEAEQLAVKWYNCAHRNISTLNCGLCGGEHAKPKSYTGQRYDIKETKVSGINLKRRDVPNKI
jgi:hypothetical protein